MTTASDPEQIRRDIERTQAALSQDVDALTEKVTPSKIVERRVDRAKDTAVRLKEKVMGSDTRASASDTASNTLDKVSGTASSATSSVQGAAATAADRVQGVAADAAGAVQQAPQALRRQTRGNPLAAGVIAFGAGWLVSSLLPATRREQEFAGQARQVAQEKVQPVVQQVAGEVGESLRGPAQDAVESVKATAQDAKDTVAEHGRSAAEDVRGRTQDATGNVRSSTNNG